MFRNHRFPVLAAAAVFAAGVGLTACGSAAGTSATASAGGASATPSAYTTGAAAKAASASPASASSAAIKLAKVAVSVSGSEVRKQVLVTASGRAVYLLTGDSRTHSQCSSSSCLSAWPALTSKTAKPKLGKGVHGKLTIWKHGGLRQLVLAGHPLYTYAGDSSADVANGNGVKSFGGTWWVMNSAARAAKLTTGASTSTTSTGSGGGW